MQLYTADTSSFNSCADTANRLGQFGFVLNFNFFPRSCTWMTSVFSTSWLCVHTQSFKCMSKAINGKGTLEQVHFPKDD